MMLEPYQIQRLDFMKEILEYVGDNFILKGGTALRFYYGLDRYSEDLDFDSISSNMDITKQLKRHRDFHSWKIYEKKVTQSPVRLTIDYGAKTDLGIYPLKIDISGRDKIRLRNNLLKYSKIDGINVYNIETLVDLKSLAFCQYLNIAHCVKCLLLRYMLLIYLHKILYISQGFCQKSLKFH